MSYSPIREPVSFGKRASESTVILTRNGKSHQFCINPVVAALLGSFVFVFMIGYFGATAYLVFRDDLIAASYAKQARMKHEYEDRLAALRSKLDRVTSRQLLDQQAIEIRVRDLMKRQDAIGTRTDKMSKLLEKAEARGLGANPSSSAIPIPRVNPAKSTSETDEITTGSLSPTLSKGGAAIASAFSLRGDNSPSSVDVYSYLPENGGAIGSNAFTNKLFGDVSEAIEMIDAKQRQKVSSLRASAISRSQTIMSTLDSIGVKVDTPKTTSVGGPFEPLDPNTKFDDYMNALEDSLQLYDHVSSLARDLPIGTPVKNAKISSHYGSRVDPFNGRIAMHSGTDFKAPTGTPVFATGNGKVVKAGRKGGYGKVVEIQHENGMVTRYAHLSRITVKVGKRVKVGDRVGKVGSTGRSTGPHLHYEVRRNDSARNPAHYMKAGRKLIGVL
ncbi:MAG: M23 family metallopeptidase [Rhizobiaceae bacterium]|nr:M23 family metallopeptidase [Rhizobiaceae bacterium]